MQRYPADYDGVIAGAPVYTPLVYSNAILRVQAFHARPESNLLPAHVPLIQKAVLAACDMRDGVADGILTDPRACTWDPGELRCKGAASADCLTAAQVETVRRVYAGVKTKDGRYAAMPLMRGGESDWVTRMIGTPQAPRGVNAGTRRAVRRRTSSWPIPSYDFMTFDPERDMATLNSRARRPRASAESRHLGVHRTRRQAPALARIQRSRSEPALDHRVLRRGEREGARGEGRGAALPRARRAALRRRRRPGSLRHAGRARAVGREGHAARVDAGDQGELAAVAAALPVSAAAALQGHRRHERRRQLRLFGTVNETSALYGNLPISTESQSARTLRLNHSAASVSDAPLSAQKEPARALTFRGPMQVTLSSNAKICIIFARNWLPPWVMETGQSGSGGLRESADITVEALTVLCPNPSGYFGEQGHDRRVEHEGYAYALR